MPGHGDLGTVREEIAGNVLETLDEAEDVIPAAAVQTRHVIPEFIEDLVHFKGRQNGFDEHRGLDGSCGDAQRFLGRHEDIVPQTRFQVALHFREVEIRAAAPGQEIFGVVEKEESEIEQASRDGCAVNLDMFLHQVPTPRAHDQSGDGIVEAVLFAFGTLEPDGAVNGIAQVDLALDGILPGGTVAVLEIGHVGVRPRIEGVDHHLAVHRSGDLHPPVAEIGGHRRHFPVAFPDVTGLLQEIGQRARIDLRLDPIAAFQQFPPPSIETPGQGLHEGQRLGGHNGIEFRGQRPGDGNAVRDGMITHGVPSFAG